MRARALVLSALATAALMVVPTALADPGALGMQKWYPSGDDVGDFQVMYRSGPQGRGCPAAIQDGDIVIWQADEASAVALDMSGPWDFQVDMTRDFRGVFTLHIGKIAAGVFVSGGSTAVNGVEGQTTYSGIINVIGLTINPGEFLAVQLVNTEDPPGPGQPHLNIRCGDDTFVQSPELAPDYPVPELGTLLLAGAGLGAVGLVIARRKP